MKGWEGILDKALAEMRAIDPDLVVVQVKEKFGLLRIYVDSSKPKEVYEIADKYESESGKICEYCGTTEGVTREGNWIKTLCKKCRGTR